MNIILDEASKSQQIGSVGISNNTAKIEAKMYFCHVNDTFAIFGPEEECTLFLTP